MKNALSLAILLLFSAQLYAQVKFQKAYGGTIDENIRKMVKTNDGGYIMAGSTFSFGSGIYENMYVVKTNSVGNIVWKRAYGGTDLDIAEDIIQTTDGGFAILGGSRSFVISGVVQALLIKIDIAGNIQWSKSYYVNENETGFRMRQTTDGGYILACESFSSTSSDVLLIKTDTAGNIQWQKSYGDSAYLETPRSIEQLPDKGYIVSSMLIDIITPDMDIAVLRVDSSGNIIWQKKLHTTNTDRVRSVHMVDTCFWVAGTSDDSATGLSDFLLIKLNQSGNVILNRTYGGAQSEFCEDMAVTPGGNIILLGESNSFSSSSLNDGIIIKTNDTGGILWQKSYGTTFDEYMSSVALANDYGLVLAGITSGFGNGQNDFYLIKTDSLGNSGCMESVTIASNNGPVLVNAISYTGSYIPTVLYVTNPASVLDTGGSEVVACITGMGTLSESNLDNASASIIIAPNPFTGKFKIEYMGEKDRDGQLIIYDISGKEVFNNSISFEGEINLSHLIPGTYFARVVIPEYAVYNKMLIKR